MTISVKHTKTSAVADSANSQIVQPSDWNAEHTYTMATGKLVGRTTASAGSFEEIAANTNHFTLASKVLGFNTSTDLTGITQTNGSYTSAIAMNMQSASGTAKYFEYYTGSSLRWQIGKSATAESGSNVGSDYAINRFDDTGAYLSTPFLIERLSGYTTVSYLKTGASSTSQASVNMPHGAAPTTPTNGDFWTTSAGGLFVRVNGTTRQYVASDGTYASGTWGISVSGSASSASSASRALGLDITDDNSTTFSTVYPVWSSTSGNGLTQRISSLGFKFTPNLGIVTTTSLRLSAGTASQSPLTIAHGVAPTTPTNGDIWTTTAGWFVRINGATKTGAFLEGATFTGAVITAASATGGAGFNLPAGTAPTTPTNGDLWTTSTGMFVRIAGATKTVADLESTQTITGAKTMTGLTLAAGTASVDPLTFTSGTLLTTATAGTVEYDGKAFYATSAASSRQVVATPQIVTVQGTKTALSSVNTAQAIFAAANDTLTVQAATTYRFKAVIDLNNGTTTHTTAFGFGGTATFTSINYMSQCATAAAASIATAVSVLRVTVATATVLNATQTTATTNIILEGIMRINAGGTIIPQITFSAAPGGTNEVELDSFFELWPIGTNTVVAVGAWA